MGSHGLNHPLDAIRVVQRHFQVDAGDIEYRLDGVVGHRQHRQTGGQSWTAEFPHGGD